MREVHKYPDVIQMPATIYSDIFGRTPWFPKSSETPVSFKCEVCGKTVSIVKYANHLQKCSGGKNLRASSRVQSKNKAPIEKCDKSVLAKIDVVKEENVSKKRKKNVSSSVRSSPSLDQEIFSQLERNPNLLEELETMLAEDFKPEHRHNSVNSENSLFDIPGLEPQTHFVSSFENFSNTSFSQLNQIQDSSTFIPIQLSTDFNRPDSSRSPFGGILSPTQSPLFHEPRRPRRNYNTNSNLHT